MRGEGGCASDVCADVVSLNHIADGTAAADLDALAIIAAEDVARCRDGPANGVIRRSDQNANPVADGSGSRQVGDGDRSGVEAAVRGDTGKCRCRVGDGEGFGKGCRLAVIVPDTCFVNW